MKKLYLRFAKSIAAAVILFAAQFSNLVAQTSVEIERLTAEIARNPKYDSLYAERGLLYT